MVACRNTYALVFAMDMYKTVFADDPLDPVKGKKYRDCVLRPGGSRDEVESLTVSVSPRRISKSEADRKNVTCSCSWGDRPVLRRLLKRCLATLRSFGYIRSPSGLYRSAYIRLVRFSMCGRSQWCARRYVRFWWAWNLVFIIAVHSIRRESKEVGRCVQPYKVDEDARNESYRALV
jgi:hypothetical protein